MKQITVTVEQTNTGFSAGADKYPVYTAGNTIEEIKQNIVEALSLYFEHNNKQSVTVHDIKLILDKQ